MNLDLFGFSDTKYTMYKPLIFKMIEISPDGRITSPLVVEELPNIQKRVIGLKAIFIQNITCSFLKRVDPEPVYAV